MGSVSYSSPPLPPEPELPLPPPFSGCTGVTLPVEPPPDVEPEPDDVPVDAVPPSLSFSKGSLFVLLACVCWGFENNCTSSLSGKDTRQIVMIKGFGSGTASLLLSLLIGEKIGSAWSALSVMILGFLAVGLSVYFYVLAQSRIGAARTSAYYAVSPFIGVLLSLLLFREIPGKLFWAALVLMAAGVYLNVKDTGNV